MARLPRLTVPGLPHHVLQRGHNRGDIVLDDVDRQVFMDLLRHRAAALRVAVHGWVLMPNHVHLLLTPPTSEALPQLMQGLGRDYARHFNARHGRSGSLWEGRYRATVVEAAPHLLDTMAYIDLNPVRAGLAAQPEDYAWSSHGALVGRRTDPLLTAPALYWALGDTPFARERAYAERVQVGLSSDRRAELGRAVHAGWALGSPGFLREVEQRSQRRASPRRAGRPRKAPAIGPSGPQP